MAPERRPSSVTGEPVHRCPPQTHLHTSSTSLTSMPKARSMSVALQQRTPQSQTALEIRGSERLELCDRIAPRVSSRTTQPEVMNKHHTTHTAHEDTDTRHGRLLARCAPYRARARDGCACRADSRRRGCARIAGVLGSVNAAARACAAKGARRDARARPGGRSLARPPRPAVTRGVAASRAVRAAAKPSLARGDLRMDRGVPLRVDSGTSAPHSARGANESGNA